MVPGRREAGAALWRGHTVAALAGGRPVPRALGVLPGSPYRGDAAAARDRDRVGDEDGSQDAAGAERR